MDIGLLGYGPAMGIIYSDLERQGYNVRQFRDAITGMSYFMQNKHDIIIVNDVLRTKRALELGFELEVRLEDLITMALKQPVSANSKTPLIVVCETRNQKDVKYMGDDTVDIKADWKQIINTYLKI